MELNHDVIPDENNQLKGGTVAQTFDLGVWNILNLKYNHTDRRSFIAEAQLRSLKFYSNNNQYNL